MARSRYLVLFSLGFAAACTSVTKDAPITASAGVIAVFSPNTDDGCLSDLPFPTDLARDPYTGLMNIPYCHTDSADTIAVKTALRGLDGYAITTDISFHFSDSVGQSSIPGNVLLLEAGTGATVSSTPYYFENRNHLVVLQHAVLKPGTSYIVVVSNSIQDASLQPVVSDQVFTFLKSTQPLIDDKSYTTTAALSDSQATALEPVRAAYQPLLAVAMQATGWSREQIALAWGFTTTTETFAHLSDLAGYVRAEGAAGVSHDTAIYARDHALIAAAGIPADAVCSVHTGHVKLKSVLGAEGLLVYRADGKTPKTTDISVDYIMTIPKTCTAVDPGTGDCTATSCDPPALPTDPVPPIPAWNLGKVVVFAHGLGRCKNDALAVANSLASAGYAVLSLDGPHAGSRMVNPLGDQDMDGCADQAATPELVAVGTHDPNPFAIRDGLRQWSLELVQVVEELKAEPWIFTGQAFGAGTPEVALVGHSWGGIAATLAAPLAKKDGVLIVRSLATSATPSGFGDIFAPLITAQAASELPVGTSADVVAMAASQNIAVFRWALEPADPYLSVTAFPPAANLFVLNQLVETGTTDVPLHATADQDRLRGAFNRETVAEVTFNVATSGGANICDKPELAVGSLLKPCVSLTTAGNWAQAAGVYAGMQRQLVMFVAAHVVCSPNPTVACP